MKWQAIQALNYDAGPQSCSPITTNAELRCPFSPGCPTPFTCVCKCALPLLIRHRQLSPLKKMVMIHSSSDCIPYWKRWSFGRKPKKLDNVVDKEKWDHTCTKEKKGKYLQARPVKAMVFPVVMYGCESWTVKKAERRRIDAFEPWC